MALHLTLPEPAYVSIRPETHPERLHHWLMGLSDHDVLGSCALIQDALATLNRVSLDAALRLQLLEHYLTAVEMRFGLLEHFFDNKRLPLIGDAQEARDRALSVLQELAFGFKRVLLDAMERRFGRGLARSFPQLVWRIMELSHRQLLIAYRTYAAVPAGLWLDMHQLFRLAVQSHWLDFPDNSPRSISLLYRQAVLLSLVDPYHLPQGRFGPLLRVVEEVAPAAQFDSLVDLPPETSGFWVRLAQDRAPFFASTRPLDLDARADVLFNATLVIRSLLRRLKHLEALGEAELAEAAWLRGLMRAWTVGARRLFQRIPAYTPVDVRLGWPDLIALAPGDQPWPIDTRPASGWLILNESPGGFALRHTEPETRVQVGVMLGIRLLGTDAWFIGIVRWIQQRPDAVDLGIQVIAPRARVCRLMPDGGPSIPALLLPAIRTLHQPASILAAMPLAAGQYAVELGSGQTDRLSLERLLEHGADFAQQVYKLVADHCPALVS